MQDTRVTRRGVLRYAATACGYSLLPASAQDEPPTSTKLKPKAVAAVITEYRPGSHADVLIGKILEGWKQDGGPGPALTLAAMYVDQFPKKDLARAMAAKHKVPI